MSKNKKVLYIDMDGVLVDFESAFPNLAHEVRDEFKGREDEIPGVFSLMEPKKGALPAYEKLSSVYETYILSTAPWGNPTAWSDKLLWVKKFLGEVAQKRLILSHNKHLNSGHYLIDDRIANGADRFHGEHILFGQGRFLDWESVVDYLLAKAKSDLKETEDIPSDKGTQVKERTTLQLLSIDAVHEKWEWDGVSGESLVFRKQDVDLLSESSIEQLVLQSGLVRGNKQITIKASDNGFTFANFNAELTN